MNSYESLKKVELEAALDDYLAEQSERLSARSDLQGYYNSRSKALGSPVKRESIKDEGEKALKVVKKRASKVADEIAAEYVYPWSPVVATRRAAFPCFTHSRLSPSPSHWAFKGLQSTD